MNILENLKTFFYLHKRKFFFLFIILFFVIYIILNNKNEQIVLDTPVVAKNEEVNTETQNEIKTLYVDVKGSVKKPGVYEMNSNSRVIDVLNKAGLTKESNTKFINLSKIISDEMVIVIYSNEEVENYLESNSSLSICSLMVNNVCIESSESIIYDTEDALPSSNLLDTENNKEEEKININTATLEQLMTLSGIGESKAKSIIEYREENGFTKIEDIKNVSGIGEALYNKIKENITV